MATQRNKRKLAALNKQNCEELPRRYLAQNSTVPRSQEDYITQVSEEIEDRVTKKLSQEFTWTENHFLGALSRFDNFLMKPLIREHSGTAPETSCNAYGSNQGTNEEDSQSDPHPEAGIIQSQTTHNFGPEVGHDMVTAVQKESLCSHDTVHQFRNRVSAATTWWQELRNKIAIDPTWWQEFTKKSLNAPLWNLQESRKRTVLTVNPNTAVRIPLHPLKQTKFCCPSSSRQTTTILQTSVTILTEFWICQSRSRQRCPRSTGNLKSLSCLKIFSGRASKIVISWLKMTESTTSTLSWGEMLYRHLKTLTVKPERIFGEILAALCREYVKPQSMATAKHKF